MGFRTMILLAPHLGVYYHKSPRDLAYFLAYLSVCGGSLLILLGEFAVIFNTVVNREAKQ
jgi:hypothetical protein